SCCDLLVLLRRVGGLKVVSFSVRKGNKNGGQQVTSFSRALRFQKKDCETQGKVIFCFSFSEMQMLDCGLNEKGFFLLRKEQEGLSSSLSSRRFRHRWHEQGRPRKPAYGAEAVDGA